jgi:hypothetical protein
MIFGKDKGILVQTIELARRLGAKIAAEPQNPQNSLLFSLLAGNLAVETGSIGTASTTMFSTRRDVRRSVSGTPSHEQNEALLAPSLG